MFPIVKRFYDSAEDDANLLQAVGRKDQRAMIAIFDRYASVVYSVALKVLKNPTAAEDLMQDILFQVWTGSQTVSASGIPFGAWLVCVTRSRAAEDLRKAFPIRCENNLVL